MHGPTVLAVLLWSGGLAAGLVLKGESGGMSARFRESAGLTGFRLCLGSVCADTDIGLNPLRSLFLSHFNGMGYSMLVSPTSSWAVGLKGSPQAGAWLSLCFSGRPDPCPLGPGGRVFASLSNEVNNPAF